MALGLDPRFDLSKAYWVVAGIAGIDPEDASLGSAAWAEWIVDGDLGHEIDAREIPPDWKTGMVPLRKSVPYEQPKETGDTAEVFRLDPGLVEWAYQLTKDVPLTESDQMKEERARYPGAVARRSPFVLKGDTLSAGTFWIGAKLTDWANDWVAYHTGGRGTYVTSAMEDTGTLQSLTWLSRAGRVDIHRVLVLRAGSDHDLPPPGRTAAEQLARTKIGQYAAFLPALESAYRVGSVVVDRLVTGWATYRDALPSAPVR
jgi:purine nucleoside permease